MPRLRATGVVVADMLPDDVAYSPPNPWPTTTSAAVPSPGRSPDLAAGGTGSIQVTVTANSRPVAWRGGPEPREHRRSETDHDLSDNSAIDSDTVVAPYLLLEKSVTPAAPGGGPLTYRIRWENNSETMAYNATIADTLPANTTLVAGSISDGGTYSGWHDHLGPG